MTRTASIPTTETDAPRVGARGWAALVVLMLPVLLVSVDNTVLSFALPEISIALAPTGAEQLWIIDVYPLVLAGLLVTMGTLGDRFGRRKMPSTLSLLRSIFRNRDQRRMAIAVWASAFSAGSALGPIVGGFLLEHFAWGSVFLIAVPVLIPLLIAAPLLVPESRDPNPGRIDLVSIALSMATMIPVVYAIKSFAVDGPTFTAGAWALLGFGMGYLFVRRQLRAKSPMLDMALFRRGSFCGAILVNLLSVVALVGFLYFVSQHLQLVLGLSPMMAGIALVPGMLAMIVAGLSVVPVSRRVPPHIVIPAGLAFSVAGYLIVALTTHEHGVLPLVVAFVVLGIGIGAAETISNELILSSAPAAKAGAASAVSETAYELGAVLGTAVLGGIITAFYRGALVLPAGLPADVAHAAEETLAGAYTAAQDLPAQLGTALWDAAADAFGSGVTVTSLIGAGLVVVAGVIAAVTLRKAPSH